MQNFRRENKEKLLSPLPIRVKLFQSFKSGDKHLRISILGHFLEGSNLKNKWKRVTKNLTLCTSQHSQKILIKARAFGTTWASADSKNPRISSTPSYKGKAIRAEAKVRKKHKVFDEILLDFSLVLRDLPVMLPLDANCHISLSINLLA